MDRLRGIFTGRTGRKEVRDANPDEYEPLRTSSDHVIDGGEAEGERDMDETALVPFSWFEYTIFVLVGVAMLWAW